MVKAPAHKWTFRPRFRRHAYGWKSQPAIKRIKEVASHWADELIGTCKMAWSPDPELRGYFKGTINCLSALLAAGRHQELLDMPP